MLKKNDKVIYYDCGMILEGIAISDSYVFVTEKRKYIDVYFSTTDMQLPLPVDLLEKA